MKVCSEKKGIRFSLNLSHLVLLSQGPIQPKHGRNRYKSIGLGRVGRLKSRGLEGFEAAGLDDWGLGVRGARGPGKKKRGQGPFLLTDHLLSDLCIQNSCT